MLTAPHAHQGLSVDTLMYRVNLSLLPAVILAFLQYGPQSVLLIFCCLLTALVCEALCLKLNPNAQGHTLDGAAILTALILALSLPPHAPLWLGALGSFIAIAFGKHIYGGLGQNLFNPAMLARVVLLIAFPVEMTRWVDPAAFYDGAFYRLGVDGVTGATLLGGFKESGRQHLDLLANLLGNRNGSLGESSFLLLLAGGLWLMWQRVFSWHIPVATLLGCLVPGTLHWLISPAGIVPPLAQLTSGGLILGAFYILTDPVTGPGSVRGRLIFGALAGFITYCIRAFGNFPEGMAFAVLLVNAVTPLIDNYTQPKAYGHVSGKEKSL
ncbi:MULTISPECIES: RnfABCDGE type electron transport complex subunit D [Sodalis]|jgi:electron transport complex protein RnfD|uniref:Ion-translocating oxidoreductase complex subunit D n=1 Tax=Sodalis ligni TaxID=2697027 RepID=A0A4R1N6C1_9GAMM|nr:RnfABCDGE type electron transport complex subunit D [Sodalis ligni]TCL02774.1 electron transport complex protein RnfD [Sodalis ligni]